MLVLHTEHWHFYVAAGLLGLGFAMATMPTLLNSEVAPEQTSVANSVNQTFRSVGGSIGTAVATAVLAANTMTGVSVPAITGYTMSFAISGAICVLAIIAALIVPYRCRAHSAAPAGREPPGRRGGRGQRSPSRDPSEVDSRETW